MSLSVCAFASGSNGNCYLVKDGRDAVLIDAGISASRIMRGLERTGTAPADVKAVFVTHEHWDHVTGVRVLLKKLPHAAVYASPGTLGELARMDEGKALSFASEVAPHRRREIGPEQPVSIGALRVGAFRILHDAAEPLGYTVEGGGRRVAVVTDTGEATDDILYSVADADVLVLESNHDTEILRNGPYPWHLKQRIISEQGHLSNAQAARALCRIFAINPKKRLVLLAHLSAENNTPELAEQTVLTILAEAGLFTGSDLYLGTLLRGRPSPEYSI